MVFTFRRGSSLATILPVTAPAEEQTTTTTEPASEVVRSRTKLAKIDTTTRHRREDSFGIVTSPLSDGTLCNGEDSLGMAEKGLRKDSDETVTADDNEEEEIPGDGNVWDIWPVLPRNSRRYENPPCVPVLNVKVAPGSLYITRPAQSLPEGWTMHVHPEGKPYYHKVAMEPEEGLLKLTPEQIKAPKSRPLPIVTDSDPRDIQTRKKLEHAHRIARATIMENNVQLPNRCDLFIELYPPQDEDYYRVGGYCLVDHDNTIIFWAAEVDTDLIGMEGKINPDTFSEQHLKLQLVRQYWAHIEAFPIEGCIDVEHHQEKLAEQLTFLCIDVSTSPESTSMWTASQCQDFLSMLSHSPKGRKIWIIGRLMAAAMYWQFLNYYGHPSARISRFHAIEIDVTDMLQQPAEEASSARSQPTLFQKCINMYQTFLSLLLRLCVVFLFDAPTSHYLSLDRVFVDHIVCEIRFKTMMEDVIKDWGETSLLATVLWTANMAFLAIPYPLNNNTPTWFEGVVRQAMVGASLASTVFAVGSIAVGLIHVKKHRLILTVNDAHDFLCDAYHPLFGLRPLAILWSLPFAFLLWSVLTFSAAVLLFCVTIGSNTPKYVLLPLAAIMLGWVLVTVWYLWKRGTKWSVDLESGGRLERNDQLTEMMSKLRLPGFSKS